MCILSHLIECNIEEVRRRKGEEEELIKDKAALALFFEKEADPVVSEKRFGELLAAFKEKYKNKFDNFRREFTEQFIAQPEGEKLPVIIQIFNSYIHRNNFLRVFLSRLAVFRGNADQFTVKTMEVILRTNNSAGNTIFYSRENFDTELGTLLRKTDPFLSDMFAKPKILSEAIIYTLKEKKKVRDLEMIRTELEKYFKGDTMQIKGFSAILNISLTDVFQRAFERLAWWRQLLIKFTGKYASYQAQYAKQGYQSGTAAAHKTTDDSSRKGDTLESTENLPPSVIVPQHKRKSPKNDKKKSYTKKQQERAWNEFSKTLRPK
jgi:hypothetical protein